MFQRLGKMQEAQILSPGLWLPVESPLFKNSFMRSLSMKWPSLSFAFCSGSFPMRQTPFSQRKTTVVSLPRNLHTRANDITVRSAQSGGCWCVINRNFPIYYISSIRHNFAYIYSSYSNLPDNTDTDVILCYVLLFTQCPFSGIYPWRISLFTSFLTW